MLSDSNLTMLTFSLKPWVSCIILKNGEQDPLPDLSLHPRFTRECPSLHFFPALCLLWPLAFFQGLASLCHIPPLGTAVPFLQKPRSSFPQFTPILPFGSNIASSEKPPLTAQSSRVPLSCCS